MTMRNLLRILAVIVAVVTLLILIPNTMADGLRTWFFAPDILISVGLLAAAYTGGRGALLAAFGAAGGVYLVASLGQAWTEGAAAAPPGATIGAIACALAIGLLLRQG